MGKYKFLGFKKDHKSEVQRFKEKIGQYDVIEEDDGFAYLDSDKDIQEDFNAKVLKFNSKPYMLMHYYCKFAPGEVSGFGKTKFIDDDTILVTDLILLKQKCSPSHTSLEEEALHQFIFDLAKKGESPEDWRLWWHTHNDFAVFWSHIDNENIKRIQDAFGGKLISTCINKKGNIIGRIDEDNTTEKLAISIEPTYFREKWSKRCQRRIKKLVEETEDTIHTETPPGPGLSVIRHYEDIQYPPAYRYGYGYLE